MKIRDMIQELERRRDEFTRKAVEIAKTIGDLKAIESEPAYLEPTRGRRGRKSMGAAERLEVAARMRRYWANRRKQQQKGTSG